MLEQILGATADSRDAPSDSLTLHAQLGTLEERLHELADNLPDPASADRTGEARGVAHEDQGREGEASSDKVQSDV
jgi:hypothetical protein